MKVYHIINPAAGKGLAAKVCTVKADAETVVFASEYPGGIGDYLHEVLTGSNEECRVIVYGGDGTINEAVTAIMRANAADRTVLSVCPTGTGNDLVRVFADAKPGTEYKLDILACDNGTYILNMLNIGFDCSVVSRMAVWKKRPFIKGTLAYIMGVLDVLFKPLGTKMHISWTDTDGVTHEEDDTFLLCAAGNAQYCGGGFRGAPEASLWDGVADLLLVRVLSRARFLGLVGKYHAGTHIKDGKPIPEVADVIRYEHCTRATFTGMKEVCRDGEVANETKLSFTVLPSVIRYEVL